MGAICPHCGGDMNWTGQKGIDLPVGTVLSGGNGLRTYRIGAARGKGGFGITYVALETNSGRRMAIKEYFPTRCAFRGGNGVVVQAMTGQEDSFRGGMNSFLEEGKMLLAQDDLPSVVHVIDYFQANGTAYLVMEYLDGVPLHAQVTKMGGRIPVSELMPRLAFLTRDIAQLHRRGVIHRDISPDNIMWMPDGGLKLLDFGSARSMESGRSMTVLMKQGFSPIEQYRSRGQGPYTDIYALAATIYYCVTGVIPPSSMERLDKDSLQSPIALGAPLTVQQETALLWALSVQPNARPQSMEEFSAMLYKEDPPAPTPVEPVYPGTAGPSVPPGFRSGTEQFSQTQPVGQNTGYQPPVGQNTGYPPVGQGTGYQSTGQGTGYPPVGQGTGYPPVGQGTGYPPVGQGTGYPPVGQGTGYQSTGQGIGYPPVGQGTGYPPIGQNTGYQYAGQNTGYQPAGQNTGYQYSYNGQTAGQGQNQAGGRTGGNSGGKNKVIPIVVASVAAVVLLVIGIVALSGGKTSDKSGPSDRPNQSESTQGPTPTVEPTPEPVIVTGVTDDGFLYEIVDQNYAVLTGCLADANFNYMPDDVDGVPVTEIADGAFAGVSTGGFVNLPIQLETIGANAFRGCTDLSYVCAYSDVVTESSSFSACDNLWYAAVYNTAALSWKLPSGVSLYYYGMETGLGTLKDMTRNGSLLTGETENGYTVLLDVKSGTETVTGLDDIDWICSWALDNLEVGATVELGDNTLYPYEAFSGYFTWIAPDAALSDMWLLSCKTAQEMNAARPSGATQAEPDLELLEAALVRAEEYGEVHEIDTRPDGSAWYTVLSELDISYSWTMGAASCNNNDYQAMWNDAADYMKETYGPAIDESANSTYAGQYYSRVGMAVAQQSDGKYAWWGYVTIP